jgi:hypothetical protein
MFLKWGQHGMELCTFTLIWREAYKCACENYMHDMRWCSLSSTHLFLYILVLFDKNRNTIWSWSTYKKEVPNFKRLSGIGTSLQVLGLLLSLRPTSSWWRSSWSSATRGQSMNILKSISLLIIGVVINE